MEGQSPPPEDQSQSSDDELLAQLREAGINQGLAEMVEPVPPEVIERVKQAIDTSDLPPIPSDVFEDDEVVITPEKVAIEINEEEEATEEGGAWD